MSAVLEVDGVSTGYGDIQALWDLSFRVETGSAMVILGPNGAGKTTLLSAIVGLLPLWTGGVRWKDRDISRVPAYSRVKLGLSLVQEGKRVFRRRTVEENLELAGYTTLRGRRQMREAINAQYDRFPVLRVKRRQPASTLSGGEQQMLAIAQALMPGPDILILDEPTAGLAPVIVKVIFKTIADLKAEGKGILLVEQVVHQALTIADDVMVLNLGRVAHRAKASEITDVSIIEEVYFGVARSAAT